MDQNNSLLKEKGTPEDLSGADGQWMVEVPEHYEMFWEEGAYLCAAISEYAVPSFTRVPTIYVSAGEATVERGVNKLSCVINATSTYRGGDNSATNDANDKSLLGKPATVISRTNFRNYARNRGSVNWNCYTYDAHRILFWAYITEYANTNCQLPFNQLLDAKGYKQGGLGPGVTTLNSTYWSNWNGYMPFINIGITSSLGNKTGVITYQMPASYQVVAGNPTTPISVEVPSYRGIENPFGHVWKNTDGVNILIQSVADGNKSLAYISNDPSKFQDTNETNYTYVGASTDADADLSFMSYRGCENFFGNVWRMADGVIFKGTTNNKTMWYSTNPTEYNETGTGYTNSGIVTAAASGYGRKLANTNKGFIVSDVTGGNSNAGTTDYYYTSTNDNTVALVGGDSDDGLAAGPLYLSVNNSAASLSDANVGCGVSF